MVLARITDACRKHGAIIISGHHHLYSRTKMLKSVGSQSDEDPIPVNDIDADESSFVISEGLTMSITTGMGGYDGGCNGKYWNATWMDRCIARPKDHRGAVIAEFEEENTRIGTFRYMNSMMNGKVVDEFQITSRLPGSDTKKNQPTKDPTNRPSRKATRRPTRKPTESPTTPEPSPRQTRNPSRKPTSTPTLTVEPTTTKNTEIEKEPSDEVCLSVRKLLERCHDIY